MQALLLLLWTVVGAATTAAAGMAGSGRPLGTSAVAAAAAAAVEDAAAAAAASNVGRLGKRDVLQDLLRQERSSAMDDVARCVWEAVESMTFCIGQCKAEKYHLSAKEVKPRYIELCLAHFSAAARLECHDQAEYAFEGEDRRHPSGLRRIAKIANHHGRALVRAAQRTTRRAWAWAQSIFHRPSAFQTQPSAVREREGVAALHPMRPIRVPE
ncbi:MAG: hypothetical protein M1826_001510 [Phylliscum demangeonii]|nr:MAG: hypothetical protein M1826_001510 [Phylliscum demangeonii]